MSGENELSEHGRRVAELAAAIGQARTGLEQAAAGLVEVLKTGAWQEFTGPGGELVLHEEFAEFVTADPPRGLGVTPGMVRTLLADDPAALALLVAADGAAGEVWTRDDSAPWAPGPEPVAALPVDRAAAPETGEAADMAAGAAVEAADGAADGAAAGTAAGAGPVAEPVVRETPALRRLREDAPALHTKVLAGEMSANAAMVAAGFRARTISVPVSKPESAAKALRKNLSREQLAELVSLLSAEL
ncbi:hypothetical protein ACIBG7_38605 [Nonomuraea sp. NPDC050328]|uniref:hypothetical protein n=1 Tax=Nonomuraea sp. NPDC050328 TaxID=3364361 RepID=UPI0037B7053D